MRPTIDARQAGIEMNQRLLVVTMDQNQASVYAAKRVNQGKKTTQEVGLAVMPKKGNTTTFAKRVISMRFLH